MGVVLKLTMNVWDDFRYFQDFLIVKTGEKFRTEAYLNNKGDDRFFLDEYEGMFFVEKSGIVVSTPLKDLCMGTIYLDFASPVEVLLARKKLWK